MRAVCIKKKSKITTFVSTRGPPPAGMLKLSNIKSNFDCTQEKLILHRLQQVIVYSSPNCVSRTLHFKKKIGKLFEFDGFFSSTATFLRLIPLKKYCHHLWQFTHHFLWIELSSQHFLGYEVQKEYIFCIDYWFPKFEFSTDAKIIRMRVTQIKLESLFRNF